MKQFLLVFTLILFFKPLSSQDFATIATDLNQVLIEKEIYQTQISYPGTPHTLKMEVSDSYTKELAIQNITILVRKGKKNALTGNLYEVYLSCKGTNVPCILVDLGEQQYMDIHAHLLFEKEEDARKVGNFLLDLQQKVAEW